MPLDEETSTCTRSDRLSYRHPPLQWPERPDSSCLYKRTPRLSGSGTGSALTSPNLYWRCEGKPPPPSGLPVPARARSVLHSLCGARGFLWLTISSSWKEYMHLLICQHRPT